MEVPHEEENGMHQEDVEKMLATMNYWFQAGLTDTNGDDSHLIHKYKTIRSCLLLNTRFQEYSLLITTHEDIINNKIFKQIFKAETNKGLKRAIRTFKSHVFRSSSEA